MVYGLNFGLWKKLCFLLRKGEKGWRSILGASEAVSYWTVAKTKPQAAKLAADRLRQQGFEPYLPITVETRFVGAQRMAFAVPLFGNYIFVNIKDTWWSILGTFGISSLLMERGQPARVGDWFIEKLKANERGGMIPLPPKFKIGQSVRIERGKFHGQVALYQGMNSTERAAVLFYVLGRMVPVEIKIGDLDSV